MGIFSGCLLACDVDGTLISGNIFPERNIEKVRFFMDEGGLFSLSSGRSIEAVRCIIQKLGKISPSVLANGSVIYDFENERSLFEMFLPKEDHKIVQMVQNEFSDFGIEIHCGKKVFVPKRSRETDDHESYENLDPIFVDFDTVNKYQWNKVLYLSTGKEERSKLEKRISEFVNNSDFTESTATIYDKVRYYYEQLPKGTSKASALAKLCDIMSIKEGNRFAIGDYYNDVPMLDFADISAVPCDSPEDIRRMADVTVGKACDGAVADFIDYLTNLRKEANYGRSKEKRT